MEQNEEMFYIGRPFTSYEAWDDEFNDYKKRNKLVYTIANCHLLKTNSDIAQSVVDTFRYSNVKFGCKFGPHGGSTAKKRQTSTCKMDCPSYFHISLKNMKCLELIGFNLEHKNHEESSRFYKCIPENNKLTPEQETMIKKMLQLNANKKKVMIQDQYHKIVPLKKLHNMKSQVTNSGDNNDLLSVVQLLRDEYQADVHIYNDVETSTCKGIFFSTEEMRYDLKKWPEIVFLDGIYKLTNNDMTLMIFLVEDGNSRGEIAGAALLSTEERDVLEWMLNAFTTSNEEACKNIKCFMTDKDLLERDVLKDVFPMVPTYICCFHSVKIFERVVKNPEMKLNSEAKLAADSILKKMVFSSSEEEYDDLYLELNLTVTPKFMTYFNNNWHHLRKDWVKYSILIYSLGNTTNNRLDSVNGKIKQVIEKRSPLSITVKDFFQWYASHKTMSLLKTAGQFLKKPNLQFDADDSEQKYIEALTEFASTKVLREIKLSKKIACSNINKIDDKTCNVDNFEASITTCQCMTYISYQLPCRHIFTVRSYFQLVLFDKCLFNQRWSKDKLLSSGDLSSLSPKNTTNKSSFSVTTKKMKSTQTVSQKRKIVSAKVSKLINIISMSCGSQFNRKLKVVDDIIENFSNNINVKVVADDHLDEKDIETSFQNLSIETTESDNNLNKIRTPSRVKVCGRPSGYLKTTTCIKKKNNGLYFLNPP